MNRKSIKCIYYIIGVLLMINFLGCSGIEFQKYDSKDKLINVSMDYPSGWSCNEDRGAYSSYAQVLFFPPKGMEGASKGLVALTVRNSSKVDFSPLTAEAAAKGFMAKRLLLKDAKVLSESKKKLFGTEAFIVEISYLKPESMLNIRSKLISFKEKTIIFKKGTNFYFLRYENSADDFKSYDKIFNRMVKSLRLK